MVIFSGQESLPGVLGSLVLRKGLLSVKFVLMMSRAVAVLPEPLKKQLLACSCLSWLAR